MAVILSSWSRSGYGNLFSANNRPRFIASLIVIIFALQTGCAIQMPKPKIPQQARLGKVAVVTTANAPVIDVEGISQLKGAGPVTAGGASVGAAAGVTACAPPLIITVILCPLCAPSAAAVLGSCVGVGAMTGAVVGSVVGATAGATMEETGKLESDTVPLSEKFRERGIQRLLRNQVEDNIIALVANRVLVLTENQQVVASGIDYSSLAALGVDTVLEVAFTDVAFKGSHGRGLIAFLTMKADARLVRVTDNEVVFSSSYTWQGQRLKSGEWSTLGVEGILKEVQRGYQAMAMHIHENIFLLFLFPDREFARWSQVFKAGLMHGLAPRFPRYGSFFNTPAVDSLQPMFAWQAFPRERDIKRAPEQMSRVKDVRYDLVIAAEKNGFPGEIIYRREGLPENSHQLEIALSPGEHYYWTVRARFELDGRQRLTEWSAVDQYNINYPNQGSYRFKTKK